MKVEIAVLLCHDYVVLYINVWKDLVSYDRKKVSEICIFDSSRDFDDTLPKWAKFSA